MSIFRQHVFTSRKDVHIKLDKNVHANLRAKLFSHGVTMQDAFEEFAYELVKEMPNAVHIIEKMIKRRTRLALHDSTLTIKADERAARRALKDAENVTDEADHDTLYELIKDAGDSEEGT